MCPSLHVGWYPDAQLPPLVSCALCMQGRKIQAGLGVGTTWTGHCCHRSCGHCVPGTVLGLCRHSPVQTSQLLHSKQLPGITVGNGHTQIMKMVKLPSPSSPQRVHSVGGGTQTVIKHVNRCCVLRSITGKYRGKETEWSSMCAGSCKTGEGLCPDGILAETWRK